MKASGILQIQIGVISLSSIIFYTDETFMSFRTTCKKTGGKYSFEYRINTTSEWNLVNLLLFTFLPDNSSNPGPCSNGRSYSTNRREQITYEYKFYICTCVCGVIL